ncbi:MAG: 50S ribosomal protein L29 [Candidatus Poribacteria bacterium]|nr:50S ribosomal protein L29 [Candidatus Poribacteria bacterium]
MTTVELRSKSVEELKNELGNLKEALFNLKFRAMLGQLEDTSQFKKVKVDIARIHTILGERDLEIHKEP